ncbi:MAG: prolyl oligopeptidase family serine peptidase [Planctomycetaceae bacterium]
MPMRILNVFLLTAAMATADDGLPELKEVTIRSSLDGTDQPARYWAPGDAAERRTPLFVFLHSWSGDYKQNNSRWHQEAVDRNWIYLHPNFRGVNQTPQACGSKLARQDILDAIDFASQQFQVDRSRIYLAGVSGGGHMAMLMAGHHPDRFTAVSAWVGISDLARWYEFHSQNGKPDRYGQMIARSLNGVPGSSEAVDADYRDRSPLFHMHRVGKLPVDIAAGVNDGHTGSVPIWHSLAAFNRIAESHGSVPVSDVEIQQLSESLQLTSPLPTDLEVDSVLGRDIRLRRVSGKSRVTIFDGGHESIPAAAMKWLEQHRKE